MVPASPTYCTAESTAPTCQKDVWRKKSNMLICLMTLHPSIKQKRNLFRRSQGFSFILRVLLIQECQPPQRTCVQTSGTYRKKMQKCLQFLDYAASQEDAIVTYQASDMRLVIHSNTLYLSEPKACSRAGGHMFMAGTEDLPINNGAVLNILQVIRAVMSSAAEAELGTLFINAKTASQCNAHLRKWDTRKATPQSKPAI